MGSSTVSASTLVQAPSEAIFAILADPRQHPRIDGSGTVRGTITGPERLSLGAEFGMDMRQVASYKVTNRVVEFEEGRLIAWRHQGQHRWRYELQPEGTGTRVTETWDLTRYPAPVRLGLGALMGRRTRRAIEETLTRLKAAAESDAQSDAQSDAPSDA